MTRVERKMDELGRILLPMDIRNKLGIMPGDVLTVEEDDGIIRITVPTNQCKLCGKPLRVGAHLCAACIKEVKTWE